jgi:nucleotide-binding universal stress UspA family protein
MRWLRWTRDDPDHTSTSAGIRLADIAVDAVRPARSRNASTVLVAADSDADGLDAVAWAAAEASARQASLHILHVIRSEPVSSTCVWPGDTGVHDTAEPFLDVAFEHALKVAPDLVINTHLRAGDPGRTIALEGNNADLIVLGRDVTRRPHRFCRWSMTRQVTAWSRPGIGRLLETIPPPITFVRNRGSRTSPPDGRR